MSLNLKKGCADATSPSEGLQRQTQAALLPITQPGVRASLKKHGPQVGQTRPREMPRFCHASPHLPPPHMHTIMEHGYNQAVVNAMCISCACTHGACRVESLVPMHTTHAMSSACRPHTYLATRHIHVPLGRQPHSQLLLALRRGSNGALQSDTPLSQHCCTTYRSPLGRWTAKMPQPPRPRHAQEKQQTFEASWYPGTAERLPR